MATTDLGRLEPVDLREVWPNEESDFTRGSLIRRTCRSSATRWECRWSSWGAKKP